MKTSSGSFRGKRSRVKLKGDLVKEEKSKQANKKLVSNILTQIREITDIL